MTIQHQIVIDLEREDDGAWSVGSPTSETLTLNNRIRNAIASVIEKNLDELEEKFQADEEATQADAEYHRRKDEGEL